ncbi:flagellar hook-associated protein FlgK [Cohaesibacter celericrescens]|uniref:flagellar hook-associated protein FlgK n=1 Tax=Cohaesibacter celericrescens TaxID=2067669 RepID=UPI00356321AE
MALSTALTIAQSGLRATNRELEVVSSNITNANTVGYTRKTSNREDLVLNGQVTSVVNTTMQRTLDEVAQKQFWSETAATGYASTLNQYLGQVDALLGQPGGSNALDTLVNEFGSSLQKLQTSPDDEATRLEVLNEAAVLVQKLNETSEAIQGLRQNAEFEIEETVANLNGYLQNIDSIDSKIQEMTLNGVDPVGLMDQRDMLITQLSELVPVRVEHGENNSVKISTTNGVSLYDQAASEFEFTAYGTVSAETEWNADPAQSMLGSISLKNSNGGLLDMTSSGGFDGGTIGALIELRDDVLVEAQNQLDSLADGMADAFSKFDVEGVAATSGAQAGFDLDLSDLQSGDVFTFTYQDVGTGDTNTVSFVRAETALSLPLGDDVTARNDDRVVGIDFSGGMASVAAQVQTALGAAFTVSNPSGNSLRVLDDGAANTVDIQSFDAKATATGLQQEATALPFFVDSGTGPGIYSGEVEGIPQQVGFAGRIAINSALVDDPSLLVKYDSSAGASDQTRPSALYDALTNTELQFTYQSGGAPVTMTVDEFARQIISYQAEQANTAQTRLEGQEIVMNNVQARFESTSNVDIDIELANLLELQTAYSANARVMTAVKEMMDALMRI